MLSSGVLFLWLLAVVTFEWVYKPARAGRKVAYLTVASFVFLGLVLYFVLFFAHGTKPVTAGGRESLSATAYRSMENSRPKKTPDPFAATRGWR